MDTLAEVLRDLRLESSFYARSELKAPWGLSFLLADGPSFHMIVTGSCWLRVADKRIFLQAGDLVLLPRGAVHQLANPAEAETIPLQALPSERIGQNAALLRFGGLGPATLLICGDVRFAGPLAHPLLELLPCVLRLHHDEQEGRLTGWRRRSRCWARRLYSRAQAVQLC